MSASFFALFHPLTCFSNAIACVISVNISWKANFRGLLLNV